MGCRYWEWVRGYGHCHRLSSGISRDTTQPESPPVASLSQEEQRNSFPGQNTGAAGSTELAHPCKATVRISRSPSPGQEEGGVETSPLFVHIPLQGEDQPSVFSVDMRTSSARFPLLSRCRGGLRPPRMWLSWMTVSASVSPAERTPGRGRLLPPRGPDTCRASALT